ncbi:MAG TPA: zinc ABC transporter substrate-binding protein [Beijerinckiaceae bacterium]|nr:zinc ABC transporter substrate-binding protein [Beijerinckiaceae bacterium]
MNGSLPRRMWLGACALLLSVTAVANGGFAQARKIEVVATTAMIGDAVKAVGGRRLNVEVLLGQGVDPHLYKPTRADIAKMARADIIFANGLSLEAQFRDTFEQLARTKRVVLAGEKLPKDKILADADYKDKPDPHVWMDAELWKGVIGAVRDALSAHDPAGKQAYDQGHDGYVGDVGRLSDYVKRVLASIPKDKRILLTAHDAFNYFSRAYDIEVIGIQGVSTESEAGLKKIEEVVDLVVSRKLPSIFVESSVSDRNVQAVIEGAARRGHKLTIGAELFSDAMGPPGSYEGTYVGMIDHNATTITRALGGEAPQRGLNGRLGTGA